MLSSGASTETKQKLSYDENRANNIRSNERGSNIDKLDLINIVTNLLANTV